MELGYEHLYSIKFEKPLLSSQYFISRSRIRKGFKDSNITNPLQNLHTSMLENEASVNLPSKVILNSSLSITSNFASCPISRDLLDYLPGFRSQLKEKGNFAQTLHEIDKELTKFDMM